MAHRVPRASVPQVSYDVLPLLAMSSRNEGTMKTKATPRTKKKATKETAPVKKQRGTSVGSIATNLHEGSRSEYLAQYVFSSFGTAVPVPHQEDTGLDIYCTLLERDGRRAWPRAYYSIQVKSTMEPWIFGSPESVRWLIEHPLPIFLCIVHKAEARILLYHTTPRFAAWILPLHKNRLELIPGTETRARPIDTSWQEGCSFELKAPILDFTIQQALEDAFRARLAGILKLWIDNDMENIFRIKCGNHHFQTPYDYETNSVDVEGGIGGISEFGGPFSEQSVQRAKAVLKELLSHITTHHYNNKELVSAAIYATALRRLFPVYKPGEFNPHNSHLHTELNSRFGMSHPTHTCQAVDTLRQMLIDKLAQHGISDSG
jgi:hypothetical protein